MLVNFIEKKEKKSGAIVDQSKKRAKLPQAGCHGKQGDN